ncbi:MAG: ACP S-malonyltransferase [Fimbriimonadales bacterium]|nr:ACP S-malonyltransferase [Fimbriimonadales bacterium]MCS7190621.1 ACP S-malonyltransferase [Fimbriimonadales bacterium]
MAVAVVFPGQGAQRPGMGRELYERSPAARKVFEIASNFAGRSFTELCFETDEETLKRTENAQPALLVTCYAAWEALREAVPEFKPDYVAGHSVGEYPALAASGVWTFEESLRWVEQRAQAMHVLAHQVPGTMAAVIGLTGEQVEAVCEQVQQETGEVVMPTNYNAPSQIVISGTLNAVQIAAERLKEAGARRIVPLAVSGAFHSALMQPAADLMTDAYREANFQKPVYPFFSTTEVRVLDDPEEIRRVMGQQIARPVRWHQSVEAMHALGVDTFIELGVGDVLSGLIKRILPDARTLRVVDSKTLDETAAFLRGKA